LIKGEAQGTRQKDTAIFHQKPPRLKVLIFFRETLIKAQLFHNKILFNPRPLGLIQLMDF